MVKRIEEIDTLRACAIILIVLGHLHYVTDFIFFEKWAVDFAFFGLSIFFFISGFLLVNTSQITSKKDFFIFLKKRVMRIYAIYWLSIIVAYLMVYLFNINLVILQKGDTTFFKLILNILGLHALFPLSYSLFLWWFIGVIISYYILYAIVSYYSKNISDIIFYSIILLLFLLVIQYEFGIIQINFIKYYLVFIAGILIGKIKNKNSIKKLAVFYLLFILLYIAFGRSTFFSYDYDIFHHVVKFSPIIFVILIYKIKNGIYTKYKTHFILNNISYGSFSIYLFHLQTLTMFKLIMDFFISKGVLNPNLAEYLILFLGIPGALIIGYYIQKIAENINISKNIMRFIGLGCRF